MVWISWLSRLISRLEDRWCSQQRGHRLKIGILLLILQVLTGKLWYVSLAMAMGENPLNLAQIRVAPVEMAWHGMISLTRCCWQGNEKSLTVVLMLHCGKGIASHSVISLPDMECRTILNTSKMLEQIFSFTYIIVYLGQQASNHKLHLSLSVFTVISLPAMEYYL